MNGKGLVVTMARPRKQVDVAEVLRLRLEGQSWPAIARQVRLGLGTVYRAYQTARKAPQPFQNPKAGALQGEPSEFCDQYAREAQGQEACNVQTRAH